MDGTIEDLLRGKQKTVSVSPAGHRERVRETIDRNPDFSGFSDYEMLEYLLFATISRKDTKPIAKELIRVFGSLSAVLHADYYELIRVEGVGEKSAHLLSNILPIVLRAEFERYTSAGSIGTPYKSARYLYSRFLGKTKEIFLMVSLNKNDEPIHTDELSVGKVDSTTVDVMKILRCADRNGAKKIILAHNHPSGNLSFSIPDIDSTARIVSCCAMVGIEFYDHLIFHGNKYVSMFGGDTLSQMYETCDKICTNFRQTISEERTVRNMMTKLQEGNETPDPNNYKLIMLEAYRRILDWNRDMQSEFFDSITNDVTEEPDEE